MRSLVVGGTGFIGMNVARAARTAGHDVVATRRRHTNTLFARKLGVPLVVAELDDVAAMTDAMRGREVVFLCATHYPRFSLRVQEELDVARRRTANALTAARRAGVRRVVVTGSIATVGAPRAGALSDEDDPVDPRALRSVYHRVKLAIEEEALAAPGLEVIVLLPTAVLGELDVKAGTGFLVVALGNGALPFYVDGAVNVVDADDLAAAHLAAATRGRAGERYIIGGENLTVRELLERVAEALGVPFTSQPVPVWLASVASTIAEARCATARDGKRPFLSRELVDVVRFGRVVSSARAARELGWSSETSLTATLQKACAFYARHRYVPTQGARHVQGPPRADSARSRGDHPQAAARSLG